MAKKSDKDGVVAKVPEGAQLEAVELVHPGADASEEWNAAQSEALLSYRLTGQVGNYIDPTRDQEPDIAPERGVSPEVHLANPVPPEGPFTGVAQDKAKNAVVLSVEEKQERADKLAEDHAKAVDAAEEAYQGDDFDRAAAELAVNPEGPEPRVARAVKP